MSKKIFDFVTPNEYQQLVKISWSYLFVVPEILGGAEPPPQMPLSCQKRQMPLTVKILNDLTKFRGLCHAICYVASFSDDNK